MKIKEFFQKVRWVIFGPSDEFLFLTHQIESVEADFKRKINEINETIENNRKYFSSEMEFHKTVHDYQINKLTKIPVEKQVIRVPHSCKISKTKKPQRIK